MVRKCDSCSENFFLDGAHFVGKIVADARTNLKKTFAWQGDTQRAMKWVEDGVGSVV